MKNALKDLMTNHDPGGHPVFPPDIVVQVKALACELPSENGVTLSRFSSNDIATEAIYRGIVAQISGTTVWRWLKEDAIKPWQHHSWIFPRDPKFEQKAGRVLDLYHGVWEGKTLTDDEYVLSADEKTSIQARHRKHKTLPVKEKESMKVEFEYERAGALNYLAAWDVQRGKISGRCESKTGIAAFERLVSDVMSQEPYASAKRVFWIVDNGSSHRGQTSINRMLAKWHNTILVHLPVHASWLNQIEIFFSILQRKVLTPNYFSSLDELATTIIKFQKRYELTSKPFEWKFTKNDLKKMIDRLSDKSNELQLVA
ncbi:MAG: IS630 family transposase [Bacteroidota bacterium]